MRKGAVLHGSIVMLMPPLAIMLIFFFLSGLTFEPQVSISIQTDKEEYKSFDMMKVYVEIFSSQYAGDVFVSLHGLANRFGTEAPHVCTRQR